MKIVLINPIVRPESPPAYFPLGLASVAGALLAEGYDVEVFDINAHRWSPLEVQERLRQANFDWLGMSALITEYNQVKWIARIVKTYHPDRCVVLGGGLASAVPELVLEDTPVDICVIGEGEQTAVELAHAMERGYTLEDVSGIAFRRDGQIHLTPPRSPIADLGSLPPAAWHLFPVDEYVRGEKLGFEFPARTINVISGRGCPYRCSYCFHGIFGYKYRTRPPQKVVDEILYLRDRYHLDGVLFSDDTFTLRRPWVERFCELLQQRRADIKWACNGRVNLVDLELLTLMKRSGCCSIFYGIESGSEKILTGIHKDVTVEQAARAVQWSRKAGLDVYGYFIIGTPGETAETVQETVEFCQRMGLSLGFSMATPLPGTEWFELAVSRGKVTDMRRLVAQWACWNSGVLANLSSLSDEELMTLKHNAEKLVGASVLMSRSLTPRFQQWAKFRERYGLRLSALKIAYAFLRLTGLGPDPYTQMYGRASESAEMWASIVTGQKGRAGDGDCGPPVEPGSGEPLELARHPELVDTHHDEHSAHQS